MSTADTQLIAVTTTALAVHPGAWYHTDGLRQVSYQIDIPIAPGTGATAYIQVSNAGNVDDDSRIPATAGTYPALRSTTSNLVVTIPLVAGAAGAYFLHIPLHVAAWTRVVVENGGVGPGAGYNATVKPFFRNA